MENEGKMEFSDKQLQILESTEKLFVFFGYEGTSVRDIAQHAGVNVAMISYYFGSKEKLFGAIFAHRISKSKSQLESLLQDNTKTAIQKIECLIDSYVDKILSNPYFHMISLQSDQAREMKEVTKLIFDNKIRNIGIIKKIILEGQKAKEFIKGIDVTMIIMTMFGTCYHMIHNMDFYRVMYGLQDKTEPEVHLHMRKKLTTHLKQMFKSILTYEGK